MLKKDARTRNQESVGTRVSRRTVTRGIAWTAPVVAVATAAPAFASSELVTVNLDSANACKFPGQSTACEFAYYLPFSITNNSGQTVTVTFTSITETINDKNKGLVINGPSSVTLNSGESQTFAIIASGSQNSANVEANLKVCYTLSTDPANAPATCKPFFYPGTKPCNKKLCPDNFA